MRVGFTYDLRTDYLGQGLSAEETAEFDSPVTIAAIETALGELGHTVERIGNLPALVARLAAGERWDCVFNIAEGLTGFGREAVVPALLDAYRIPYTFGEPLALTLAMHKGVAKRVLRDAGIPTAPFAVVGGEADLTDLRLPYPLFAKPVAEGSGKGIGRASRCADPQALAVACRDLLARFNQPVLVETYLPGREFTVGVTGTGAAATVLGCMEVLIAGEDYSFENKENWRERVAYAFPSDPAADAACAVALAAYRALGCRDAGRVDVRLDAEGRPQVMEANPLAGLNPESSDLWFIARAAGLGYRDLIGRIMASLAARLPLAAAARVAA